MRYAEHLNAHEIFFAGPFKVIHISDFAVVNSVLLLRTLDRCGYRATLTALQGLWITNSQVAQASYSDCLRYVDLARISIEGYGVDLGYGRCLARSIALTGCLWQCGVPASLKVGMTRFARSVDEEFHAWVEYFGKPVAPHNEVDGVYEIIDTRSPPCTALSMFGVISADTLS